MYMSMKISNLYHFSIQKIFKKHWLILLCLLILFVAATLPRIYGFGTVPPSLNWDEMAVGVNGWTIATEGRDEWGYRFPLTFKSFGDDKNPVHIYTTALFIKLFGLSETSVRLPVVVLGIANVLLLFFVTKQLFKSTFVAFVSAFSLAVSPYNLIFSHFNHELNFTIFFFLLGVLLFFVGLKKGKGLLLLSFIFFAIDLLSYNSAKVVVPVFITVLIALYIKRLLENRLEFFTGLAIFFSVIGLIFFNPNLSGVNRANQTSFSEYDIKQTAYYKQSLTSRNPLLLEDKETEDLFLARAYIVRDQYLSHFSPMYLFITGDYNARHSTKVFGQFYWIEAILLVYGVLMLFLLRTKEAFILGILLLVAPIPSALFKESPHSARAMFMTGSMHILVGLGTYLIVRILIFIKEKAPFRAIDYRLLVLLVLFPLVIYYVVQVNNFTSYYVNEYPKKYAVDWQYGMKEVVEYVKERPDIQRVYVTDTRSQPYIFFRFYNPISNLEFSKSAALDESQWKSSNTFELYDKYVFGRWDKVASMPTPKVLYILTSTEYSALAQKVNFDIKKVVHYPDGGDAFFIVEGNR
jgi:4-amino-4-deoxy-L-arabinose transferase-like glycosyltransferase